MPQTPHDRLVLHKLVYELRYDRGYTFLDRCGATVNEILRSNPGWEFMGAGTQQGTLRHLDKEIDFSFGTLKLDLSQELSTDVETLVPIEEFAELAAKLTTTVVESLELREFNRIGFRMWHLLGRNTFESAKETIRNKGLVATDKVLGKDVGEVDQVSCVIVATREKCSTRIAFAPVEQNIHVDAATVRQAKSVPHRLSSDQKQATIEMIKAQRRVRTYPQFAVLVDTDHFLEDPPYPEHLDIASDFLVPNYEWSREFAARIMGDA